MTAYEIMLSESQERMLLVVKRGREREVEEIFEKWDLHAAHIGEVTDDGLMRVRERGQVVAEIPTGALTDDAPVYSRPMKTPAYLEEVQKLVLPDRPAISEADALRRCLRRQRSRTNDGSIASTTTWCGPIRSSFLGWAPVSCG